MALYARDGGLLVLLGAATVEQTGMVAGRTYEFAADDGAALIRWGAGDASIADGGFDFCVPRNCTVRSTCPAGVTAVNVIEANAGSVATATLTIADVQIR